MSNFRKVLAAALITIPVLSLGASEVGGRLPGAQMSHPQELTKCCYINLGGYWYCIPC